MVSVKNGGVWNAEGEKLVQFGFVIERKGSVDGAKVMFEYAIRLQASEGATFKSESRLEILRIDIPTLNE